MSKARIPGESPRKLRRTVRREVLPLLLAPTRIVVVSSSSRRVFARRRKLETSTQASLIGAGVGGPIASLDGPPCVPGKGLAVELTRGEGEENPCVTIAPPCSRLVFDGGLSWLGLSIEAESPGKSAYCEKTLLAIHNSDLTDSSAAGLSHCRFAASDRGHSHKPGIGPYGEHLFLNPSSAGLSIFQLKGF